MLYKRAKATRPKVYAVDFDGTIVDNAFPRIGKVKQDTVDFIKKVHARGDRVVIWTSRGGKPLEYMQKFLDNKNIPYHEINANSKFKTTSPKIIADYYIDDKAVNVNDLHKVANDMIEKTAIPLGSVPRLMSGLINKTVTTVAPIKPKLSTFARPNLTGGGTKKIADYKEGIVKMANSKKDPVKRSVAGGAGAGLGYLAGKTLEGAKNTRSAEGTKTLRGALKSMAEKAGGKGALVKNQVLNHGGRAAAAAGIAGAGIGGLELLKRRARAKTEKTAAFTLDKVKKLKDLVKKHPVAAGVNLAAGGATIAGIGGGLKYLYDRSAEKTASERSDRARDAAGNAVRGGVGAGAGWIAGRTLQGARNTKAAEGTKTLRGALKSMAEKAGGKGALLKNQALNHGKGAAIAGLVGGGILAGDSLRRSKAKAEKKADYIYGIEKIAAAEKKKDKSLGQKTVAGLRKGILLGAPVAAYAALKSKKSLTEPIGRFFRQGVGKPAYGKASKGIEDALSNLSKKKFSKTIKGKEIKLEYGKHLSNMLSKITPKTRQGIAGGGILGAIGGAVKGAVHGATDNSPMLRKMLGKTRKPKIDEKKLVKGLAIAGGTGAFLGATKKKKGE